MDPRVRLAGAVIRVLARRVPGPRRERWREEWLAEIHHEATRPGGDPGFALRAALGAGADVRTLRRRARRGRRGREPASLRTDMGAGEAVTGWAREIRLAARSLMRAPAFAAVAVVTLGVGMGGSTALFTLLDRVVLDPLPYPDAERLVRLRNVVPCVGRDVEWEMATAQFVHFGAHATTLEALGAYQPQGVNVQTPEGARRARMARVSTSLLDLVGARVVVGRRLDADDDRPGGAPVAMLSHAFWQQALGGDPVVGRVLDVDGLQLEVVGVVAPGVEVPQDPGTPAGARTDIWIPMGIDPSGPFYNNHVIPMVARLAPGRTVADATDELGRLTARLPEAFPDVYSRSFVEECGFRAVAYDLEDHIVGDMAGNLWLAFGAVGVVLLIACANVGNLVLVRSEGRAREMALRAALGAGRRGLLRTHLAESLVLASAGGVLALAVAAWGIPVLVAAAPDTLPRLADVGVGTGSAAFTLATVALVTLLLVVPPLLRLGGRAPARELAAGGRGASGGPVGERTRAALVVAQVALALTLVMAAGILVESVRQLRALDPGVEADGALVADLYLAGDAYADEEARWAFYEELLARLGALPGVVAAGLGSELPLTGGFGCTVQGFEDPGVRERIRSADLTTCAGQAIVTPGYFEALGIPVLQGRSFEAADNRSPERAAVVVSRAFARRFWPGEDPVGKGVAPNGSPGPWFRVVGVVGDVKAATVQGEDAVAVYYPVVRRPEYGGFWYRPGQLVVRGAAGGDPLELAAPVRKVVRALDPAIPLAHSRSLASVVANSMARVTFVTLLLQIAAATALLLAGVGLYGVVAYLVGRRTREIGTRLALGAEPGGVVAMVVGQAARLTGVGLAAGAVLAWLGGRLLEGLVYGVEPRSPAVMAVAALLLGAVALVAAWVPARRAARIDPATALRSD